MAMKEGTSVITLRINKDLKFALERESVKQSRSLNNLITHVLKLYLEDQKK